MFDPYHKWLGIPSHEQPPNHYRLLGLTLFESDPEVIDSAANRQMSYLQSCANGPHGLLSQRLLNDVAAARLSLLNSEKKANYDAALKRQASSAKKPQRQSSDTTREVSESGSVIEAVERSTGTETEIRPNLPARRQDRPGPPSESKVKGRARTPLEPEVLEANYELVLRPANPGRARSSRSVRLPVIAAVLLVGTLGVAALVAWRHRPVLSDGKRHDLVVASQDVASIRAASADEKSKTEGRPAGKVDVQTGELAEGLGTATLDPEVKWDPPKLVEYPKSNFKPLFNGQIIDGPLTQWSNCWLEEQFTDFVLRFDYRLRSHGREPWNGVRLRAGGNSRLLSLVLSEGMSGGLLFDRSLPELKKPLVEERLDDIHRVVRPALDAEKAFGEWNECQVVCEGPETIVSVNHQVVNHIIKGPSGTGMVCLAGFETGVAFRDIRVMKLGRDSASSGIEPEKRESHRGQESVAAPQPNGGVESVSGGGRRDDPFVLQWKTNDWRGSDTDYAKVSSGVVRVGMGASDFGIGEVGAEVNRLSRVKADVKGEGSFRKFDENSIAGFIIDYHTPGGYTKRESCYLGGEINRRRSPNPSWGKGTLPDAKVMMTRRAHYNLDLDRWAPQDWDGKVWFTVILQNTGRNTQMTVDLKFER
jgi:Domain of Unknown Function (DUF1080)